MSIIGFPLGDLCHLKYPLTTMYPNRIRVTITNRVIITTLTTYFSQLKSSIIHYIPQRPPLLSLLSMEEDKLENWQVGESMGYYEIVVNNNNLVGELYTLPSDGLFQVEDQIDIYRMRKLQNQFLVKVYHVQRLPPNSLCFGQESLKIITERIPHRLDQVRNLTQNEALYTLYRCLRGFKVICEMLGPVVVEERMIGIDPTGTIKVWINENYSRNYAEGGNKIGLVKDKAIQKMVVSILDSIKTYNLPEELVLKLKRILATSMEEHIAVTEKYLKQNRVDVGRGKVNVMKQEHSLIEGAGRTGEMRSRMAEVADESTSMIEGVPHPVAQMVHQVSKPKFMNKEKEEAVINPRMVNKQVYQQYQQNGRANQLLAPPIQVNPPSRLSPIPQGRPMSPFPNNPPMSNLNPRGLSPMPNMNAQQRPSSHRPMQQFIPHPQQFLQLPQHQGLVPGQLFPSRALSPRPVSPRPLSPNPLFVNQVPQQQVFIQQQAPISKQPQQQQHRQQEPQRKSNQSKGTKKSTYMAESQCFPLGSMPQSEYSPVHPQLSPQQYQQMVFQQMNGNPFANLFGQQLVNAQMFGPPEYLQQGQPSNMNLMPPQMGHLNMKSIQEQHHYIHSQIMSNLQNHLNGPQGPTGYMPTFKRM